MANNEKNINSRIQHKHDVEANWLKAENFIPRIGELIIYDPDENYSYARFKIGDGETLVNDLAFTIDIVDNLETNDTEKVLSAAQGVVIKSYLDELKTPITIEEINEICAFDDLAFDERGNVVIDELLSDSTVSSSDGNVSVISENENESITYDKDGNVSII